MTVGCYIALGGNVGDVEQNFRAALAGLAATSGVDAVSLSPVFRTQPVGQWGGARVLAPAPRGGREPRAVGSARAAAGAGTPGRTPDRSAVGTASSRPGFDLLRRSDHRRSAPASSASRELVSTIRARPAG